MGGLERENSQLRVNWTLFLSDTRNEKMHCNIRSISIGNYFNRFRSGIGVFGSLMAQQFELVANCGNVNLHVHASKTNGC